MHHIKDIRKNLEFFKKKLIERNSNYDLDALIVLIIKGFYLFLKFQT